MGQAERASGVCCHCSCDAERLAVAFHHWRTKYRQADGDTDESACNDYARDNGAKHCAHAAGADGFIKAACCALF